jgi:DNA repair protein RadD
LKNKGQAVISLRPYQSEAVKVANETEGSVLIVAPTGSGKTHIIAGIVQSNADCKILIISHVKEILWQNRQKLRKYVASAKIGVYSQGLNKRDIKQYTIASIQTIYKKPELFMDFDIVIIDEVHTVPAKGTGRYRTFLSAIGNPRVIGLTATPFRLDHGLLTEGHLFDKINYNIDIVDLINAGYLCPVLSKATQEEYDLNGIVKIAGDYSLKSMSEKLDNDALTQRICVELLKHKHTRKKWLLFAIDINHAESISRILNSLGVISAAVHSKQDFDRKYLLDLFEEDHIQALVSVASLTTGFDSPSVDLIGLLRPTQSAGLLVQMVGRGLRTAENKKNCLVLDFASNIQRLGPINDLVHTVINKKDSDKKGFIPTKRCPDCQELVALRIKVCPDCGYTFPEAKPKLVELANEAPIISTRISNKLFPFEVNKVDYSIHYKVGKPSSLKVTYTCGIRKFFDWVPIEAEGYPRVRAKEWWWQRSALEFPETTKEALELVDKLKKPKNIHVLVLSKYPEIVRYEF